MVTLHNHKKLCSCKSKKILLMNHGHIRNKPYYYKKRKRSGVNLSASPFDIIGRPADLLVPTIKTWSFPIFAICMHFAVSPGSHLYLESNTPFCGSTWTISEEDDAPLSPVLSTNSVLLSLWYSTFLGVPPIENFCAFNRFPWTNSTWQKKKGNVMQMTEEKHTYMDTLIQTYTSENTTGRHCVK